MHSSKIPEDTLQGRGVHFGKTAVFLSIRS
jgi:hypothetical protein